ncbi:MAG: hypothetical protein ACTSW1_03645 [Candidatus Hodarchaeales archaeon]
MNPKWIDKEAPKAAMETLNLVSGITLWSEMVRDRREFCLKKCQNNKVVNMLRPKCTDRRYLDVLLLSRESKKNMPMFCYSQRVKGLIRSFKEGKPLLADVYIYLDDYWKILHEKKTTTRRTASDLLKRTLIKGKEVLPMGSMDQLIETHLIRDQIFLLWPKLDLCLVNARETNIHSMKMFRSIIETLSTSYGISVQIEVEGNYIELRFENLKLRDPSFVEDKLQESQLFTGFLEDEAWAEIQLPSEFEDGTEEVKVKDIHQLFKIITSILSSEEEVVELSADKAPIEGISELQKEKNQTTPTK